MKALLLKDIAILKNQTKLMAVLALVCIIMCFTNEGSFAIGYMGLLASLMAIGTLSYDEYDHGFTFLFTLPVTRNQYVVEKYVFTFALVLAGILIGVIATLATVLFGVNSCELSAALAEAGSMIILAMVLASVMIPVRIKYGSENAKIVSGILLGAMFALVIIIQNRLPFSGSAFEDLSSGLTADTITCLLIILGLAIITGSLLLSLRAIRMKEF